MSSAAMAGLTGNSGAGPLRTGALSANAGHHHHRRPATPLDAESAERAPASSSSNQQQTNNLAACLRGKALGAWNMFTARKKGQSLLRLPASSSLCFSIKFKRQDVSF